MGVFDSVKEQFSGKFSFGGVVNSVTIIIFIGVLAIVVGIGTYMIIKMLRYNKKIILFENIAGQGYVPTGNDRAMTIKIGDGGEEVLYLRKRKIYRTAYGKKIGKNTYAFAVGSDGYWYNIDFGNLDTELKKLGINPIDRDMRYMHVAIRRNIKDRYEQITFLQKYGGLIAYISLIAVTGIMMWLLFDKFLDIANASQGAIDSASKVLDKAGEVLGAIDNIQSGGSGFTQT